MLCVFQSALIISGAAFGCLMLIKFITGTREVGLNFKILGFAAFIFFIVSLGSLSCSIFSTFIPNLVKINNTIEKLLSITGVLSYSLALMVLFGINARRVSLTFSNTVWDLSKNKRIIVLCVLLLQFCFCIGSTISFMFINIGLGYLCFTAVIVCCVFFYKYVYVRCKF